MAISINTKSFTHMQFKKSELGHLSKTAIVLWGAFLLWAILVCELSSLSASQLGFLPHIFVGFDKVVHCTFFFVGSIFLAAAARETVRWPWAIVLVTSILTLSLFAWGDEIHQVFTVGRSGLDFGDWMADFTGATAGSVFVFLLSPRTFLHEAVVVSTEFKEK